MPLGNVGRLGERDAQEIDHHADRLPVEIAGREVLLLVREEQRVVRRRIHLDVHDLPDVFERIERRPQGLWRAAHAVPVLHLPGLVRHDLAAGEELDEVGGNRVLPGIRPRSVNARVESVLNRPQRVERHRRRDHRVLEHAFGVVDEQRGAAGHHLRPVDQAEALLECKVGRHDACPPHRLAAGEQFALVVGFALADGDLGELGHGRQVAADAQ